MKKFLRYISPLAPDDSGACSVLYELGGITVICDAGGCAGNVCGFDEPRWFTKKSALFSAGLRDMDAILGRDDRLVAKLALAQQQLERDFTAIVGTPVPAVIATDYKALERMAEKKTGVPCITVQTDGTKLYDKGEEEAYLRLFKTFAKEKLPTRKGTAAVIGATPLDTGFITADTIVSQIKAEGFEEVKCIGFDSGLDEVKNISRFEKIFVISPAGIRAGNYLKDNFSLDVEVHGCPLPGEYTDKLKDLRTGGRTLIIHQQMTANAVRDIIGDSTCGTFFMLDKTAAQEGDFHIKDEEDLAEKAKGFDLIIADISLKRALPEYKGEWFDLPHFAVSGRTFQ
ncbi:nitrogenase component 1 [Ruminococcus albus]|uniref:nitrogenase component 1 n=1 Tax=Ruminococcus albus TaxID=1264 RepID=UPI000465DD20|nr:nitrogenase component 1 [Ruminococcus albus]